MRVYLSLYDSHITYWAVWNECNKKKKEEYLSIILVHDSNNNNNIHLNPSLSKSDQPFLFCRPTTNK